MSIVDSKSFKSNHITTLLFFPIHLKCHTLKFSKEPSSSGLKDKSIKD